MQLEQESTKRDSSRSRTHASSETLSSRIKDKPRASSSSRTKDKDREKTVKDGGQTTPGRGAVPKQRDGKKLSVESRASSQSVVVHSPDRVVRRSVFSSTRHATEAQAVREDRVENNSRGVDNRSKVRVQSRSRGDHSSVREGKSRGDESNSKVTEDRLQSRSRGDHHSGVRESKSIGADKHSIVREGRSKGDKHSGVRDSKSIRVDSKSTVREDRDQVISRRTTKDRQERDKTNSNHRRVEEKTTETKRQVKTSDHRTTKVEVKADRIKDAGSKKEKERTEVKETKGRTRTRTRVLSPSEVKMEHNKSLEVERERKEREENRFPVPVASTSRYQVEVAGTAEEEEEEVDYEDDFEDYESDFEEDSADAESDQEGSVVPELAASRRAMTSYNDEEKKLDSGHYDMGRSKHLQEMRAAIDRENSAVIRDSSSNKEMSLPEDEGFEEEKSDDLKKTNFARPASSFINFAHARKRQMELKVSAKTRKRGDDLLAMITLDVMSYKIYESTPASYDLYMASYGRAGTAQAQVQTNEDNLHEEVQTEEIRTKDAWTQKPPVCQARGGGLVASTIEQDRLGVGGELPPAHSKPTASLDNFLARVSDMMMAAIQESGGCDALTRNPVDIGFSKGFVTLKVTSLPFLKGRAVTMLRYPASQPCTLLTVHAAATDTVDVETVGNVDVRQRRSVLCVWSITTPSTPQHVLASWHDVTAACFDADRATLVLAGLSDGAVCCWDLREATTSHEQVNDGTLLLRSPSYSTAEVLKEEGHSGPVTSIQPLIDKDSSSHGEFSPSQVCSLDESGVVIIWTVIQSVESGMKSGVADQDLGMAYWGRVRLVKSSSLALEDNLQLDPLLLSNLVFTDLRTNTDDCNHLYVTTNTGHVVHGLKSGAKPSPRLYHARSDGLTFAKCIETFPFGHSLFLVGCGDGSVRLHRRESENPLTTLAGTGDAPGQGPCILDIQWSRSRPTIFFVLDELSRIHVWDLGQSDMYPRFTSSLSDAHVTSIQMAPDLHDAKSTPQMAIATVNGSVEVHHLKDDYRYKSSSDMSRELNNFIRFTNIL